MMTSRERVLRSITFSCPDRAPVHHYIMPGAFHRHGQALTEVVARYPDDFRNSSVNVPAEVSMPTPAFHEWRDPWGSLRRGVAGYTNGEVIEPAIPDWDAWASYRMPPLPEPGAVPALRAHFESLQGQWPQMASGGSLFQTMEDLRRPGNLYMDLADNRPEVHELADAIVAYRLQYIAVGLAAGVDIITFGDDWGAQDRLLISPAMWRRFFKPRYERLFAPVREAGKLIWFHSDGWILEIIPDLIELGVNVLNPQHTIMGNERVARLVSGKVCIRTDVDRQWLIPQGSPEEIREYIRQILCLFGAHDGGIILHGEVGPDVPLQNIRAMYAAFRELGCYPLTC